MIHCYLALLALIVQLPIHPGTSSDFDATNSVGNAVHGKITMPQLKKPIRLQGYVNKDGSTIMYSDDPMAEPHRNVIVMLHPLTFTPVLEPTPEAYVTQREQTFLPHVLPVTRGTTVYFLNEDELHHSVYSLSHRTIHIGKKRPGVSQGQKINKVGVIRLTCDIHEHMSGVILSLDTPYFSRADQNGRFTVADLPDGEYLLKVFHPKIKHMIEERIALSGGTSLEKNYSFLKP